MTASPSPEGARGGGKKDCRRMKGGADMLKWLRRMLDRAAQRGGGTLTRTCKRCGKTFTLPENVQSWPDLCFDCRALGQGETVTRKCRRCGKAFTFPASSKIWPKFCPACRARRMNGTNAR